jgi:hypothetical protein
MKASIPEMDGYADAVRAAKKSVTDATPDAGLLLFVGSVLAIVANENDRLGLPSMAAGIAFSLSAILFLAGLMLVCGHFAVLCVAQRLGFAMSVMSERMGWHWTPTETNAEGHPLSTGRVEGVVHDLPFVWETRGRDRVLTFSLPALPPMSKTVRDFEDVEAESDYRAWAQSVEAFPETSKLLKQQICQRFGRDLRLRVDDDLLIIQGTAYKERGLAADDNIARRQREVAAIMALARSASQERQEAIQGRPI